jgi:hypothetical protein
MTGWYAERTPNRSAKAVTAVTLLALLLVAAVPVALLAAVVMMMLGHVVGGLALFGGSVLAAAIAVTLAGMSGMRHLRKLLFGGSFRVVQLDGSQYADLAEPQDSDHTNVVQLDRSEYTEVDDLTLRVTACRSGRIFVDTPAPCGPVAGRQLAH